MIEQISQILNIEIINNSFIYLSLWSFAHLTSGMWVMFFILKIDKNKRNFLMFLTLFVALFWYEIIEFYLMRVGSFFIIETWQDTTWDMIVGMLGGFLTLKIYNLNKKNDKNEK